MKLPESEKKLPAFQIKQLTKKLKDKNLLETFKRGKLKCFCCGRIINESNIGSITKREEETIFTCTNATCINKTNKTIYRQKI